MVADVEEEVVFVADDVCGASDRDRDLDAATMIGGVASNADENSPDRLRNRLIVQAATKRHAHRASKTWRALSYRRPDQSISASRTQDNARKTRLTSGARTDSRPSTVYSAGTAREKSRAARTPATENQYERSDQRRDGLVWVDGQLAGRPTTTTVTMINTLRARQAATPASDAVGI